MSSVAHPHIHLFPDPVLRKKCLPITDFGQNLASKIELLERALKGKRHGIGIAAPQVGLSFQLAIVDVSARVSGAQSLILINPKILALKTDRPSREGCMSLPDYTGLLKRYDWVQIRWQNKAGLWQEKVSSGIEAVCIQHEVDHLNGMLFIDRVTSLKTDMMPRSESKRPRKI